MPKKKEFARSDTHGLARRVQWSGDLAHHRGVGRVADVENQNARMHVRAGIQAIVGVSSTRVVEPTTTGAVGSVTDVKKILENGRRCIHAAIKQGILTHDLEIQ